MKKRLTLLLSLFLLSLSAFSQTSVLVLGAYSNNTPLDDVKAKLESTSQFTTVDIFNIYSGTPTLSYLQGYDAVLMFTDGDPADATTLGNNVADYIDGGGGLVNAVFSTASIPVGGRFATSFQLIIPVVDMQDDGHLTLGTINVSNSPLVQGVTSFDGGTSSYRALNPTLVSGCTVVAEWSDGDPLIVVKDGMGAMSVSRVDLNFYPPSSTVRSDFWDASTDGAEIMANAILYVAGVTTTTGTQNSQAVSVTGIYPNPSNGQFTIAMTSTTTSQDMLQIVDAYGRVVYTNSMAVTSGSNVYSVSTELPKGIYFVSLTGNNTQAGKLVVE